MQQAARRPILAAWKSKRNNPVKASARLIAFFGAMGERLKPAVC